MARFQTPESVIEKKALLLELAKKNPSAAARPPDGRESVQTPMTRLGQALRRYTRVGGECYDPKFVAALKEIAPEWLPPVTRSEEYKAIWMERALDPLYEGRPAPGGAKVNLDSKAFFRYMREGRPLTGVRARIDAEFKAFMRRHRPDWLVNGPFNRSDGRAGTIHYILKIAEEGGEIPGSDTVLGQRWRRIAREDKWFAARLRRLRPELFRRKAEVTNINEETV